MGKNLIYSYDKETDVLYASIGEPQEAIAQKIADEVFAQFNPVNKEIVGFTISNFAKQFVKSNKGKYFSFNIPLRAKFYLPKERYKVK